MPSEVSVGERPVGVRAMSLHAALRRATAGDHALLDGLFSRFDLADAADYRCFLEAHARALLPIEAAIGAAGSPADWRERGPLIVADLAALGVDPPSPLPLDVPGSARLWGMRYVVEGSRLGGALLARRVGAALPASYLGAQHGRGEWRAFLERLDAAGAAGGPAFHAEAAEGARAAFALFAQAVALVEPVDG